MNKNSSILNSSFVVREETSLKEAMAQISVNEHGTVIVVNNSGYVMGIASDGDIRRSIVKGITTFAPISKVMNRNCIIVKNDKEESKNLCRELFEKHPKIMIIPVVGEKNILIDIIVR